ncbi:DUF465 domain-containing protein [bacterium]|nr:DUF465 domain-containing protein [bacterium]
MDKHDLELIRSLLDEDFELRKQYEEHERLDRQIDKLGGKAHLSPSEEAERKRLQKLKLAGRDRMVDILRTRHAGARAARA